MVSYTTTAPARPFAPELLTHPDRPLSAFAFLRTILRNPLELWPRSFFTEDKTWLPFLGRRVLFVCEPSMIEEVLVTKVDLFPKAPIIQRTIGPAVGENSIFTAHGADWRWQRRASSPPFRHDRILDCVPAMEKSARSTRDHLLGLGDEVDVDIAEAMMATTFDIICETMLSGRQGFDTDRFGGNIDHYFSTVRWIALIMVLRLPAWTPYPGRARARAGNRFLRAEMARVVAERRARPGAVPDLLDFLVAAKDPEDGRAMTDAELADNLLTFVVAGHETTAIALTWALWLIANAPDVEARLVAEVTEVAGSEPIRADHVDRLVYAKQVIQEAMRLFPPAAVIPRIAREDTTVGTEVVKARTPVYVPVYAVHRHQKLWDNPAAFDPDRFAPEAQRQRQRGAYLPFGAGPRICIGASFAYIEAVVVLATLIRDLKFQANPDYVPTPVNKLTLRPIDGMPMRVSRRVKAEARPEELTA